MIVRPLPRRRLTRSSLLRRPGGTRRVLVVSCHPCDEGLIPAARERVLAALGETTAEVRHHDLYAEGFRPVLDAEEHRRHIEPGCADDVVGHADDLRWCDTLVLVYPTWWSSQPAMLKGWFDRVWAAGVAWELPEGANRLRPTLRNVRDIVVVTSHGSNKLLNSLQGEGGKRIVFRGLRAMCHPLVRCHWMAFYGVDADDEAKRLAWLDRLGPALRRVVA